MPKRIQRKRTKGWRMPENAVSITRPGRGRGRVAIGIGRSSGGRTGFAFDHNFNGVDVFAGSFALFVIRAIASFGDGINAIK